MIEGYSRYTRSSERLAFLLCSGLLIIMVLAGGASRADVLGQAVCRIAAFSALAIGCLFLGKPDLSAFRSIIALFGVAVAIVAIQLVPLPPTLWAGLPGREELASAYRPTGLLPEVWHPLTLSPALTLNALFSLVVPGAFLFLGVGMSRKSQDRTAFLLLGAIALTCVAALLQLTGVSFSYPLINYQTGEVSGFFANRNHFALFLAVGILLLFYTSVAVGRLGPWSSIATAAGTVFFLLLAFVVGSRGGLILCVVAVAMGLAMSVESFRRSLRGVTRRTITISALATAAVASSVLILSLTLGRAATIARFTQDGSTLGLRGTIRPIVIEMIGDYMPFGTGFGTFDPAFRIAEPDAILGPRYVNQAHNDLLQIPLDGGLPGLVLMICALAWLAMASYRVWRAPERPLGRLGSSILILIVIASAMDYPARTPLIMAITAIAATWLSIDALRTRTSQVKLA